VLVPVTFYVVTKQEVIGFICIVELTDKSKQLFVIIVDVQQVGPVDWHCRAEIPSDAL